MPLNATLSQHFAQGAGRFRDDDRNGFRIQDPPGSANTLTAKMMWYKDGGLYGGDIEIYLLRSRRTARVNSSGKGLSISADYNRRRFCIEINVCYVSASARVILYKSLTCFATAASICNASCFSSVTTVPCYTRYNAVVRAPVSKIQGL